MKEKDIKTIYGFDIEYLITLAQSLRSREIIMQDLEDRFRMYKCGYENGIKIMEKALQCQKDELINKLNLNIQKKWNKKKEVR